MTIIRPNRPAPVGAEAVPDSHGLNLYRADPALAALLPLYLPRDLLDGWLETVDRSLEIPERTLSTFEETYREARPGRRDRARRAD